MNKIFTLLTILVAFGLIFGGTFLFSGVSSIDVSEDSVETLDPVVSQSHDYCDDEPYVPDPCGGG